MQGIKAVTTIKGQRAINFINIDVQQKSEEIRFLKYQPASTAREQSWLDKTWKPGECELVQ